MRAPVAKDAICEVDRSLIWVVDSPPNCALERAATAAALKLTTYEALIAEFRTANPAAKIYVSYPPPCFPGQWGIDDDTIHHEIIPMVQEVAQKSGATVIDMYNALSDKKALFPDTVHPNDEGAKLMAAVVYHDLTGKEAPANE